MHITADKLPQQHSTEFRGLPIIIEWPKDSERTGVDPDGTPWKTTMLADYGYIPGTTATGDKERLDILIGPDKDSEYAYIVEQLTPDGETDEYKCMLGFASLEDAEKLYVEQYGEEQMGEISEVPFDYLFDKAKDQQEESGCFEPEPKMATKYTDIMDRAEFTRVPLEDVDEIVQTEDYKHPIDRSEYSEEGRRIKGSGEPKRTVIDAFVKNYEHEVDFYQEVASLVQEKLDQALQDAGIKAVVSSRAKRPVRLRKKLERRAEKKNYQTFRDIYDDIVDLAGCRVALYLPADRPAVGKIIEELFAPVRPPKHFPKDRGPGDSLGYIADHYLIRLRPEMLRKKELRYADTQVEIQVASVLMHAWAEVTHDLIYKPEKGELTHDELVILKDLNDIVQAGEKQLEKLQSAIEGRTDHELRFALTSCLQPLARTADATLEGVITAAKKIASMPGQRKISGWDVFIKTRIKLLTLKK